MVEYKKVDIKSSNTQLKKLKTASKNKIGRTLTMGIKMFDRNDLSHELLLRKRQKSKLRNAFYKNMSTDVKLSKAHVSKVIKSGGFVGSLLNKLVGLPMKAEVPSAKKCFSSNRNYSSCFSNWCRNSKENTWFSNSNFNNFK